MQRSDATCVFIEMLVSRNDTRFNTRMIISFRHKGIEAFYRTGTTKGIQATHAAKLRRILGALDVTDMCRKI